MNLKFWIKRIKCFCQTFFRFLRTSNKIATARKSEHFTAVKNIRIQILGLLFCTKIFVFLHQFRITPKFFTPMVFFTPIFYTTKFLVFYTIFFKPKFLVFYTKFWNLEKDFLEKIGLKKPKMGVKEIGGKILCNFSTFGVKF